MKKILVPIDFSDCAKNALRNAIKIAERTQMELVLYHSLVVPVGFAEGAPVGGGDFGLEEMEKKAKQDMAELIDSFAQLSKVKHSEVIQYGSLYEPINEMIADEKVRLVVMGTHGASGFARNLVGSNAYHVMKNVDCPVIALPEDADITKMTHIGLAGDYLNGPNPELIRSLIDIARAFYAQIHVIHIDSGDVIVKDQIEIARRMEKYLKNTNHTFHFRKFDDIEKGLLDFKEEKKLDMMAMIAKHHNLFDRVIGKSHTKSMMLDIPMPLMILHEE